MKNAKIKLIVLMLVVGVIGFIAGKGVTGLEDYKILRVWTSNDAKYNSMKHEEIIAMLKTGKTAEAIGELEQMAKVEGIIVSDCIREKYCKENQWSKWKENPRAAP